jgi:hypothetical protein
MQSRLANLPDNALTPWFFNVKVFAGVKHAQLAVPRPTALDFLRP